MSVYELKMALRNIPGISGLTVGYAANGNQLITIAGKTVEVGPMASNDEIALALKSSFVRNEPSKEITAMSITGATHLADQIKAKIQAAKDRMAQTSANTDTALAKLNSAADAAEAVNKSIAAEADDLLAQIGQFTNGAPE
jgi:hypothetical protein